MDAHTNSLRFYDTDMPAKKTETGYDLEDLKVDWATIVAKEEERGRWSYNVEDGKIGRKIALEYVRAQGWEHINNIDRFCDPKPIEDMRLDSNQISFSEYDRENSNDGPIVLIEIYMRYYQNDKEYYDRYMKGINFINEKIEKAKQT